MRFVAVDLETANPRMSSICQAGVVVFENGSEVAAEVTLIDPQEYFDPYNVAIHGIDESRVVGAKTFCEVHAWIMGLTKHEIVICHTPFDRVALAQACGLYKLEPLTCKWLDTARVARRAWPKYAACGYGLSNLARDFGIEFQHHNALDDARTAGLILLRAIQEIGLDLDGWMHRVRFPLSGESHSVSIRREGQPEGPLTGQVIVFTGSLEVPRREAADMAHAAGCGVEAGVTRHTTLLVVGDQDVARLGGKTKSAKHLKAELLISQGQRLRILQESDFMALVRIAS